MKELRWAAICSLALAVAGCRPWDKYTAFQSEKYSGARVVAMYEEWGPPVSRMRLISGAQYYGFQKPATDCRVGVWADTLNVVFRLTFSGPSTCSAGF